MVSWPEAHMPSNAQSPATQVEQLFRLDGRVAIITGGAGMLGVRHAEAIAEMGGVPVLWDYSPERLRDASARLAPVCGGAPAIQELDITDAEAVARGVTQVVKDHGRIDILINNAAMTVESSSKVAGYFNAFEDYPLALWEQALRVSLTGAFLCSQAVGKQMKAHGRGVMLNIASDVGVVSPDRKSVV